MNNVANSIAALSLGLDEYVHMFGLTNDELNMRILDCNAGASCFAADMHQQGKSVIACDPLYGLSLNELKIRLVDEINTSSGGENNYQADFFCKDAEKKVVFEKAIAACFQRFLADFTQGCNEKRYVSGSLPKLNFADESFNLVLMHHYLFSLSDQLSVSYHLQAIEELLRIASEVRIFPLTTIKGKLSPYVGGIIAKLQEQSYGVEIRSISFKIQDKGNAMLRIWAPHCQLKFNKPSAAHQL